MAGSCPGSGFWTRSPSDSGGRIESRAVGTAVEEEEEGITATMDLGSTVPRKGRTISVLDGGGGTGSVQVE